MTAPCPNCGRLNRPGARFCASCQAPLGSAAPPAPPIQPGQMLGSGGYRVVRPLGKGGMGAVWLVAQTKAFDRLAVLKEVIDYFDPSDADARQEAAERFEAEARTLADLKHPGIPDLYAYFSEAGHNYLVMEYVEGQDLSRGLTREDGDTGQLVPGAALAAGQVLQYTIEICGVLEYLAARQPPVVHNDIKPANILVDSHSGRAVLVDFGTAKTRYLRAASQSGRKRDSVYGTVGYAAPELYQGRSEPRSDVYSLAATAYHLLTDDDPRDHPAQYPGLSALPADLAQILQAALAPRVEERPTATQFREQLESYLAGRTAPMRALPFPGGDAADERDELLSLAVKHWHYAASLLQDGTLARWLLHTLRDPAAAQAAQAAASRWPGNGDAALDTFIRALDARKAPPGSLEVRTPSIRLPAAAAGQRIRATIELANRGAGFLQGEAFSTQPWIRLDSGTFGCAPGEQGAVSLEIDTSGLAPGQPYLEAVTLVPAGGTPEVIPIQISVAGAQPPPGPSGAGRPSLRVAPERVDLGTVSRQGLSTARARVTVANTGAARLRCRVLGAPEWLLVKPDMFDLLPGAQQPVELVGRADKIQGRKQEARLVVTAEGLPGPEVQVSVRTRGGGLFGR